MTSCPSAPGTPVGRPTPIRISANLLSEDKRSACLRSASIAYARPGCQTGFIRSQDKSLRDLSCDSSDDLFNYQLSTNVFLGAFAVLDDVALFEEDVLHNSAPMVFATQEK